MAQWTPHPAINELLQDLFDRVQEVVGSEFVGMYLYGSLASGDFQPDRSDVDLVVVTADRLTDPIVSDLASMHEGFAVGGSSAGADPERRPVLHRSPGKRLDPAASSTPSRGDRDQRT
jgi:hypothetical protein